MLPEFPEDGYPNVPEMEPLKELLSNYLVLWKQMDQMISDSLVPILVLDVANKTPQDLLQRVVETMESKRPLITVTRGHWPRCTLELQACSK